MAINEYFGRINDDGGSGGGDEYPQLVVLRKYEYTSGTQLEVGGLVIPKYPLGNEWITGATDESEIWGVVKSMTPIEGETNKYNVEVIVKGIVTVKVAPGTNGMFVSFRKLRAAVSSCNLVTINDSSTILRKIIKTEAIDGTGYATFILD